MTGREVLSFVFGALVAGDVVLLAIYDFFTFKHEVHSDSAVKVLLAEEVLETGELFPRDWVYANGDIYAFFSHSVALPFVKLFGPGFTAHAGAGLVIGLSLLVACSCVLRELAFPLWQRLAVIALIGSGISGQLSENLFGQATYGFIIMMNLAVVGLALVFMRRGVVDWWPLVALTLLTTLIAWNNPRRALMMLSAPFVAACGVELAQIRRPWNLERVRALPHVWLLLAHAVGLALGLLAHSLITGPVTSIDATAVTTWLGPDQIWRNTIHGVVGVLGQLGGFPAPGGRVVSVWGVYEVARLGLAVLLLGCLVKATRAALSSASSATRFVATFIAVSGGVAVLFFVFTSLPDATTPLASTRYLVPTLVMAMLLLPLLMTERPSEGGRWSVVATGVVLTIALCGAVTLAVPGNGGSRWHEMQARSENRLALLEFLESQGLKYGYATYWNAGAISLLSNGRVIVRQIHHEPFPTPTHLHSSNRWYRAEAWKGETFLLLSQAEFNRVDKNMLAGQLGPPARSLATGEFKVLVYPKNIAGSLGWNSLTSDVQHFEVTAASPHRVGRFVPEGPASGVLQTQRGDTGEVLFGPFIWLAAGRYRVSFDVSAEGDGAAGALQVTSRQAALQLVTEPLQPGPRERRVLEFEVANEERFVEFRVLANGTGSVTVHGVTVERLH